MRGCVGDAGATLLRAGASIGQGGGGAKDVRRTLALRGGGDAAVGGAQGMGGGAMGGMGAGAGGGGDDDDDTDGRRTPIAPRRFEPFECTRDADELRKWSVRDLVREALRLYGLGRHPAPNVWTPKGNLRAKETPNGVIARCEGFIGRETDGGRVRAKSQHTARAQDIMTIAVEMHGHRLVVRMLMEVLIANGPPDSDDEARAAMT